jgi:hypothetical protein
MRFAANKTTMGRTTITTRQSQICQVYGKPTARKILSADPATKITATQA